MLENVILAFLIMLWIVMSYEDIKSKEVSIILLTIFFVTCLIFAFARNSILKNTSDILFSTLKVLLISGIQLMLDNVGLADFVFSLSTAQIIDTGTFKVRLLLGPIPTSLWFSTSLIEPIYINTYTTLLRICFLKKLQKVVDQRLVKLVVLLPFIWMFALVLPRINSKNIEVPFIPLFGLLVLITGSMHIIVL